jgi:S-adenosyl-L-methionine hydrolase (adenosine-forming)
VGVITLLTDFGLDDTYVGQMKGAILTVAPEATLVDLTHAVAPQDIQAGAFLLWSAVEAFPASSIHVAVVDPGVGSSRRPIAVRSARGDLFVGPDNGLLIPAVDRLGGRELAVELIESVYWRKTPSSTFHGRDIFGPVAGHLANGVAAEQLGQPTPSLQPLALPQPHGRQGEVIHVDTFGNLITNLPAASLPPHFAVRVGRHRAPAAAFYAAVEPGALLAMVGSAGLVEVSARNANAAALTGATRGTRLSVEPL